MKNLLLVFLTLLSFTLFADGGPRNGYNRKTIDHFERSFNLYYSGVSDTLNYMNDKDKEKSSIATVNVAIYNIDKDSTSYLFDLANEEAIVSFFFESNYLDIDASIDFNNTSIYSQNIIRNNFEIPKREISEKLVIVTYSFIEKKHSLWTCHKTGSDLQKIKTYQNLDDLRVDIYNHCFIFISENDRQLEIEKIPY
jgi:hypothetical protein